MQNKKLEHWTRLLLDTGKRNNLVNFRETKSSSAEILIPGADELFERARQGTEFEVFMTEPYEFYMRERAGSQLKVMPRAAMEPPAQNKSDQCSVMYPPVLYADEEAPFSAPADDREDFIKTYGGKLKKKKQILLYSSKGDPLLSVRNIEKRARAVIEETGVNVAYMTFGFMNWTEEGNRQEILRAPLILIPIRISRKSAVDPWLIRTTDDELVVNPTFDYLISAEKGVGLPVCKEDDTLETYLTKVNELAGKLGWTVSSECRIGLFSFLKINMYHDLVEREEEILRNPNVRALLGETNTVVDVPPPEDGADPILHLHTVIDADSSQMEAILMAKQGGSFVLQGPPGTGKSQTITNIIAECLHDGRKVLFVSEKQAALNVVYDKLVKAGLEDFCLELHSYKANKKNVITELVRTLNAEKTCVLLKAQDVINAKERFIDQLDEYEESLHMQVEGPGVSVYEMYDRLTYLADVIDTGYTIRGITEKGSTHLTEALLLMEAYVKYVPEIGEDYRKHTWYGYIGREGSHARFTEFADRMDSVQGLFTELEEKLSAPSDKYGVRCFSFHDYAMLCGAMELLSGSDITEPALLDPARLSDVISVSEALARMSSSVCEARNAVQEDYGDRIYDKDGHELKELLLSCDGFFARLFSGDYRRITACLRECSKDGRKRNYETALRDVDRLILYQDRKAAFDEMAHPAIPFLGDLYQGIDTDWDRLLKGLYDLKCGMEQGLYLGAFAQMPAHVLRQEKPVMRRDSSSARAVLGRLAALFSEMQPLLDTRIVHLYKGDIRGIREAFSRFLKGEDTFYNWTRFLATLRQMQSADVTDFVDFIIDNGLPIAQLPVLYEKTFYTGWLNYVTYRTDALADFTRAGQDLAVREFARTDRTQFEISRAQIRSELSAKRPSTGLVIPGSQVALLRREGEKKRRQKAIRTLFKETGELIQLLKPCFLMSPLSVGTFLGGCDIDFDVVVFDEASQIFPQDAIGAISRGKQLIVVGDSKQMPPTNFFTSMVEAENETEDDDVADFESILDLCRATFPQLSLKWHYRSRYESLIAFSNHSFYNDTLVTFPSVTRDRAGVGIDYEYVPEGIFDRKTHRNRAEAERVVELVFNEAEKHPSRSLGVVAFSISQQDMIERLLAIRRRENPSFEAFFSSERSEPFFIKNLETVQGDERDTIIFSTAYGKDESGKLYHNFGPLNRSGGERRLNVAVTRAKENVILVSSMHYTDIDPNKSSAEGVVALRNYLQYAELGQCAPLGLIPGEDAGDDTAASIGEVLASVRDFLTGSGFTVDSNVGFGNANVELAVRDAEGGDYVLAVETDGQLYHEMKNVRDRDRLREEVLGRMGWKYYRIWSTEWMRNGAVERERLYAACRDAMRSDTEDETVRATDLPEDEDEVSDFEYTGDDEIRFSIYRQADVVRLARTCSFFQEYIAEILKIEAPLSEEELLRRIVFVFGRDHVTQTVKREFDERMIGCERFGIERRDSFLYLTGEDPYIFRMPGVKRPIRYIALEELAGGMRELLHENVSAEKEAVYRKIAGMLGYARVTDSMHERLDLAYELV